MSERFGLHRQIHTGKQTLKTGSVSPCGYTEPEDNSGWEHTPTNRVWQCEGGRIVVRGDDIGYEPGSIFISGRDCPKCGWKIKPWSRVFAPPDCDGTADQCVEWDREAQITMDDARGGGGDELEYDGVLDMFRFNLGSGPGPMCYVTNPRPGNPLEGAKIVYRMADTTWE